VDLKKEMRLVEAVVVQFLGQLDELGLESISAQTARNVARTKALSIIGMIMSWSSLDGSDDTPPF
jgi:hypothetical protein